MPSTIKNDSIRASEHMANLNMPPNSPPKLTNSEIKQFEDINSQMKKSGSNALPPKPPGKKKSIDDSMQPDPVVPKDITIKQKKPLQPLIVSYEVKTLKDPNEGLGVTKDTSRTNDLLLSEYLVKPMQKSRDRQSNMVASTQFGSYAGSLNPNEKLFSN